MISIVGQDPSAVKRVTCNKCASILEYTPADTRVLWSGRDISGVMCRTEGLSCPKCHNDIITYAD